MLEEAVAAGDRALVFTQFREMGDRLVAELERTLGEEVPFLHGGVARAARDAMVRRFQEDPRGPRVFVLSVKAGGTGLNLTAANQVFHYDRWWNPAVEDQATDRAHRIGQTRAVQVRKLLCAGTVEEKVDRLLVTKRDLAAESSARERWITELTTPLRDLLRRRRTPWWPATSRRRRGQRRRARAGPEAGPSRRRDPGAGPRTARPDGRLPMSDPATTRGWGWTP
jgi:superfamily II DNA/RNA helicase